MKKYAIVNSETNEFYPDPIYEDEDKIVKKIQYLHQYQIDNNMKRCCYGVEVLDEEREAQHNKEWNRYVSMID
uniref:Uncharacterized protein n=1 Tax=viral metagenome TaxID=1070528 RepID=A0A6H1ZTM3_9ZZZZ